MPNPAESRPGALGRNTVWNIAGQAVPLAVAIAAIPGVVRNLGPERFGILSIAWLVLGYFALLDFGLGRAATKFIAEGLARREFDRLPSLVCTSVGLQILMGAGAGLLLAGLTPVLAGKIFPVPAALEGEARRVFLLLAFSLPVVLATNGLRAVLEAAERFDLVNLLRVPASLSAYLLPALGAGFGASLPQIVLFMVMARVVVGAAHLGCCVRILRGWALPGLVTPRLLAPNFLAKAWSGGMLKTLLGYGGWVTVSNLANPVLLYADRFFIASLLSLAWLGAYTVPFEAVTKLWIIPASLASSLFPTLSALAGARTRAEDRSRVARLYAGSFKYLLLLLGPVVVLVVLFAGDILTLWMGASFARQTTTVLQILALGVLVNCFAHIPFSLLQSHGRPRLAAVVLLCELPLYLPTVWMLVRHWGIRGAAIGWTARVTIEAVIFTLVCSKVFSLHPHRGGDGLARSLIAIAALSVALVAVKFALHPSLAAQLAAAIALTSLFCALVWQKILEPADRGQVQGMFEGVIAPLRHAAKALVAG